jgi:hypothetical protein
VCSSGNRKRRTALFHRQARRGWHMRAMVRSTSCRRPAIWLGKAPPLLLLGAVACSLTNEPLPSVTLLVTNGTCQLARCEPLRLLGFPSNQPNTPGGFWSLDLGLLGASSACITLPPTASFYVIGVSDDGTRADTTTYTWTTRDSISLGAQPSTALRVHATPTTAAFVPASAPGWRVTLPDGADLSPTQSCTPSG